MRRGSGSGGGVPQNGLAPSLSSKAAGSPQRSGSLGARAAAAAAAAAAAPQVLSTPAAAASQSRIPGVAAKVRPGLSIEEQVKAGAAAVAQEEETWRDIDEEEEEEAEAEDTETLNRTVSLLSAHKRSIADTVEDMKGEMQLVQGMEDSEDRNVSRYVKELATMLERKETTVKALRKQVAIFFAFRKAHK